MELKEVQSLVASHKKAVFTKVSYFSLVKPLAKHKTDIIVKYTNAVVRFGVQYSNMAVNKDKVTGDLPYGHWFDIDNYIIEHNGKYQLRMSVYEGYHKETSYTLNGEEVSEEYLLGNGYMSQPKPHNIVFNVPIEHITQIG